MRTLSDREDAFGHAILDWLEGGTEPDILERDDGFIQTGAGHQVYLAPHDEWPAQERVASRYARGRVLDVGCGAGRVALHLQDEGLDVLGVDLSPRAVRGCRLRGLRRVAQASIADIGREIGPFDTALLMGNNFGLFGSAPRAVRMLRGWHAGTGPDARILAESTDPYGSTDPAHRGYRRQNRSRGRLPGQVRLRIRYRRYATPWSDYLFVSRAEMDAILRGTGWHVRRFIDSSSNPALYVAVIEKDGSSAKVRTRPS